MDKTTRRSLPRASRRGCGVMATTKPILAYSAENWMKCGTEFFDSKRHASVVFTREYSDWFTMPDLTETGPVWWRAVRKGESLETLCSLDGKNFISARHGCFPASPADVGVMCAAPEGAGFNAEFDQISLSFVKK